MTRPPFPLSALVGQDELVTALLVGATDPHLGGVLIRGDRGTAKTTAVRALVGLLPPTVATEGCPYRCQPGEPCPAGPHPDGTPVVEVPAPLVELPLGATEDRVVGTLDLRRALRGDASAFQPGLLAAANGGLLYIDEVNLLPDHLVDLLLDVAASGINRVERDGLSVTHPARFLLVGTMNPDEGDLRPQLLDRFGLAVDVTTPTDPAVRVEIIRRRLAFDTDPEQVGVTHATAEGCYATRLRHARRLLERVHLSDQQLHRIARLCAAAGVEGVRADLACARAARALAALDGRTSVTDEDIDQAARLALRHRTDPDALEELLDPPDPPDPPGGTAPPPPGPPDGGPMDDTDPESSPQAAQPPEWTFTPAPHPPVHLRTPPAPPPTAHGGRRLGSDQRGRRRNAPGGGAIAWAATLRRAAREGWRPPRPLRAGWISLQRRTGSRRAALVVLLDSSGSMAARRRMRRTKGAVAGLLRGLRHGDRAGLVVIAGGRPQVVQPLGAPARVLTSLPGLPTGGRTPLADGLRTAAALLTRTVDVPLLVVFTDGRHNIGTADPVQVAAAIAERVPTLWVDTEEGPVRLGRVAAMARAARDPWLTLDELPAAVHRVLWRRRRS